jgi:cellulose synthase/poly-beta-1,6-N-acetylglucosamine synthase-like glycosyltransferase/peptidoglycan/xylan/chitin deacetylase (PgdA/CDA1 family)/spore germination protein YaaH
VIRQAWLALSALLAAVTLAAGPARADDLQVFAFHAEWMQSGRPSLYANAGKIDVLMPDWLRLDEGDGSLVEFALAEADGTVELLDDVSPNLSIVPFLSNTIDGRVLPELVNRALGSRADRQRLIAALLDYVQAGEHEGITIGFWGWGVDAAPHYEAFAVELHQQFNPLGLAVYHALPIGGTLASLPLLAEYSDALIVMGDGESQTSPGPLASQQWYKAGIDRWMTAVPADKLVMGVFNHAVSWDKTSGKTDYISVMSALDRAEQAGVSPRYDATSGNATFAHVAADGTEHTVWMLDAVSSYWQLRLLADQPIRGIALQRLGSEDPSLWSLLDTPRSPKTASIETIDPSYIIGRSGTGEAITLGNLPRVGARDIDLAEDGVTVQDARYTTLPRGYDIRQRDAVDEKMIALTFDDGPDPRQTPLILDILKREGVKATFFAVGNQMLRHPAIVERIVAEGHEIGNHTFSHTNISSLTPEALRLELNATQSVFESITGRHMALFRGPYAVDANPQTAIEIAPLAMISELGYLTITMKIDPRDWWLPSASRIAATAVNGARSGLGNVVLLHDGGGDRTHSIEALPVIIKQLRDEGFSLVTVSEMLGVTPEHVMPRSAADVGLVRQFKALGYTLVRESQHLAQLFFVVAIGLGIARALILIGLSFARPPAPAKVTPDVGTVGVVIAAFNEEKVIVRTIESLLNSTYRDLRILVVDDGSTDGTFALGARTFAGDPRVQIITQPNAGKAAALNLGFAILDTKIVIGLDADTIFLDDTVEKLIGHFSDPLVAAVSGNAKVGNRGTILTKLQALEYITAQNLDRRAFAALNCITVVPGAIGAWRRDRVLEAGGYLLDTLAEDADLTIRLIRNGYRVAYEDAAIALTEAPQTVSQFLKQRFRWMFGMLQVAVKHLGAMRLKDSKTVGLVALPNIILFQVIFPLLAPLADLFALGILIEMAGKLITNSGNVYSADSLIFLALFFTFVLVDAIAAAIAFSHEKRENPWLLLWILPQRFFYRQLIYLVAIRAALAAIRGSVVGWGTLTRSASVSVPTDAKWSQ